MKRSHNRIAAGTFAATIVVGIALLFTVSQEMATAQSDPAPEPTATEDNSSNLDNPPFPESPPEEDVVQRPARDFFEPYPADEGAQTWDDLSAVEKAAVEHLDEVYQADHSPAVHAAYARGTASRVAYAKLRAAEHAAGLENIDELGVE